MHTQYNSIAVTEHCRGDLPLTISLTDIGSAKISRMYSGGVRGSMGERGRNSLSGKFSL